MPVVTGITMTNRLRSVARPETWNVRKSNRNDTELDESWTSENVVQLPTHDTDAVVVTADDVTSSPSPTVYGPTDPMITETIMR